MKKHAPEHGPDILPGSFTKKYFISMPVGEMLFTVIPEDGVVFAAPGDGRLYKKSYWFWKQSRAENLAEKLRNRGFEERGLRELPVSNGLISEYDSAR
jgi:hypothetical protein